MNNNPKDILISALEELGYIDSETIIQQGSLSKDEPYPETFFTFWQDDSGDNLHLDNASYYTEYLFTISCYSNNPFTLDEELEKAIQKLKTKGFIISGKGRDAYSDEESWTGKKIKAIYLEKNN